MKNSAYEQGSNTLVALMEDPILVSALNSFKAIPERKFFLVSASNSFKAIPERKFSVYEESGIEGLSKWTKNNWVCVFQFEYATIEYWLAFVDDCVPKKKKPLRYFHLEFQIENCKVL